MKPFPSFVVAVALTAGLLPRLEGASGENPPPGGAPNTVTGPARPAAATAWVVDVSGMTPEERLCVLALQGLANRQGPRVLVQPGQSVRWNSFSFDQDARPGASRLWSREDAASVRAKYADAAAYWLADCERRGVARFEPRTLEGLCQRTAADFKGVILYERVDDDLAIAGTLAGLEQAVPATPAIYERLRAALGTKLPVVFDVRSLYPGYDPRLTRRAAAHRWAVDHLLPRCDPTGALSRDKTYGLDAHDTLIDCDLAIRNRWMIFDLAYGGAPPDEPTLAAILGHLPPAFSPVYGWRRPDEGTVVRRLARAGSVAVCTGTGNASFLQSLPQWTARFVQPAASPDRPLEHKVYVAFAVAEGDTLKSLISLGIEGAWLQPERGTIPLNWGMDPLLCAAFSGLVQRYYDTATTNDYFFAATSGWGYLAPEDLPAERLAAYGDKVRAGMGLADLRYADTWWVAGLRPRGQFLPYVARTGVRGLAQWSGEQAVEFAPDGVPIVHSNLYYANLHHTAPEVAGRIRQAGERMGAPWFVLVYGGNPFFFSEVARALPTERFKVVKLDEFFEAARQARSAVKGRRYQVAPDEGNRAP